MITVVFAALCVIALANGLWVLVSIALLAALLLWLRESGPDDPEVTS